MARPKPVVVVTRRLPEPIERRMSELFEARLNADDHPFGPEELAAARASLGADTVLFSLSACRFEGADVLVPTVTDRIGEAVLARGGPRLKLIAAFANGTDNIDVGAAQARGITVTNTPGALTEDTADMTLALILAVARHIVAGAAVIPDDRWAGWSPTWRGPTSAPGRARAWRSPSFAPTSRGTTSATWTGTSPPGKAGPTSAGSPRNGPSRSG